MLSRTCLVGLVAWMMLGCGRERGEGGLTNVATNVCASGKQWTGGDEGSSLMHPGGDCVGCHARSGGEAPSLALAGTVYDHDGEADDCAGVSGATVRVTDANNHVTELTSNAAGNFYLTSRNGSLALPYTIVVLKNGAEHRMVASQQSTSCNTCHTATGANEAPGRVLTP